MTLKAGSSSLGVSVATPKVPCQHQNQDIPAGRNEVVSLSHGFLFERHYLCCEMLASCMGSLEMYPSLIEAN